MRKVDFFICGVQKGGTTALDTMLRRHPSIQMAARKEVHFFDDEENVDWSNPSDDRLHSHFDWTAEGVIRGEATPIYTYWPASIERLHAYNPAAKLIIGLRNPVYRAYSHWRMETTRGSETLSFSTAISDGRQRVAAATQGVHRVFSYVERGFYADQVAKVFRLFPRHQVHIFRTDDLWRYPASTLLTIQKFLGVEIAGFADGPSKYIVPLLSVLTDGPEPRDIVKLHSIYKDDIQKLIDNSGLYLTDWLDLNYKEPMMA